MSCITVIWGRDGVGKTHLGLTYPKPLLLDNDRRYQFVHPKFPQAEIWEILIPLALDNAESTPSWENHLSLLKQALSYSCQTVIVDTVTRMRQIGLASTPDKQQRRAPFHYSWVNNQLEEVVASIRESKKHGVLVHRAGDEFVNEVRTGKDTIEGYKDIRYLADLVLHLESVGPVISTTIEKCAWTYKLHGLSFPDITYSKLMDIITQTLQKE